MTQPLTQLQSFLAGAAVLLAALGGVLPLTQAEHAATFAEAPILGLFAGIAVFSGARFFAPHRRIFQTPWLDGFLMALGGTGILLTADLLAPGGPGFWCLLGAAWLLSWLFVERLTASGWVRGRFSRVGIPVLFGAWILIGWEAITRGMDVPTVLLPPPSMIAERFASSTHILWADFQQTFLKAVLIGWVLGCGSGFLVAVAVDRVPFLQRGILPVGNLVSALPIIGVAPIMVMWFGFDWQSKAAVVVIMTFFPMLVNTVTGLAQAGAMERDLMRTYAASWAQTLWSLRLPAAAPFIFNALKINSTLALIGAIVAEFFGTPIVGMGFRISTEVGRMNVDMVWAEIAVAAVAGTAFFGVLALIERAVTFWHPSVRG